MQRCLRTSSMNLTVALPPEWLSQQQPLTTWFSCSTRRPEPMGGACVKTKIFQPSADGCDSTMSSNHLSCSSSMVTSWLVYFAVRKTVEPSPTSSVFSAICRLNCMVGLPWMRSIALRLASSVGNSSMPSRSWLPPMTSYGTSKDERNLAASSWHAVVPAKSSSVSWGRTDLDSPRSPRLTSAVATPRLLASCRMGRKCSRPV
mmetsp:Transcript_34125/g.81174  ORF Transcript_34125/g.81174 Transcript_34125/m.81174 type:complete len:203 (-) Transcript_34125:422-1030(-)